MIPKRRIIPIFVPHLGCPNMCVFCNQRRISGSIRPATEEDVQSTIEHALLKISADAKACVAFYGGSFTAIPAKEQEKLLGAALPFLRSGKIEALRLSTRPDCIDEETIDRLNRYGVKTVELGVQSMCPEVLEASGRGHTAGDAEQAAKMIKNAGLELILQMMTGLPEDTPERSIYTAKKLIELEPDGVRIYPTVIIKDTELYDMWVSGEYKEHTVEEAVELCAELADMFDKARIPIIRMGLNPTEDLSGGDAVAGAYHPALGELVEGRRYLKKELEIVSERDRERIIIIGVPKGKISAAVGQKKVNKAVLREKYGIRDVKFRECDIEPGTVVRIDR